MNISLKEPIKLKQAVAWRTYIGGSMIRELHGNKNTPDDNFPEEWIMSTVCARNSGREHIVEGLSITENGNLSLAELIKSNPSEILGEKHYKKYADNLGVLVKLIDSAERLTIQVHPTKEKAKELFNSQFGKTECWHILGGRSINGEKPCIYLGFKEGISREYWKDVFERQDIPAMLNSLHKFEVKAGDTFLIEGGVPHAIGPGCFLVEIQEPTDYTIRTEKITPSGLAVSDFMCHQGLGFDKMFDCFEYTGCSKDKVADRWRIKKKGNSVIDYGDTEMFRLEINEGNDIKVSPNGVFSGIYVLSGKGKICGNDVRAGDQFFIPAACRPFEISGNVKFIRFYGPKGD